MANLRTRRPRLDPDSFIAAADAPAEPEPGDRVIDRVGALVRGRPAARPGPGDQHPAEAVAVGAGQRYPGGKEVPTGGGRDQGRGTRVGHQELADQAGPVAERKVRPSGGGEPRRIVAPLARHPGPALERVGHRLIGGARGRLRPPAEPGNA